MALKIFKNKRESGAIPLSAENLNYNFQEVLNMVCPVGKVEIFYDNDDHSNYLGFTWERTGVGKAIVGIDSNDTDFNTIGNTGGEKTHTLTIDEMPSHDHGEVFPSKYGYEYPLLTKNGSGSSKNGIMPSLEISEITDFQTMTGTTGEGKSHNNLQPYQVFAIWKRTA